MGKGDARTKRGKIFKGTFGKSRPTSKTIRKQQKQGAAAPRPQAEQS